MVKSITTSSCRIHFNFTNVNCLPVIFSHSYSDVLSKQSRTTEEGNTSSLGNTEATATQWIGDTIITGCWTCMTETNQDGCFNYEASFSFLFLLLHYVYFTVAACDPSSIGLKIERYSVTSGNRLDLILLESIFFGSLK